MAESTLGKCSMFKVTLPIMTLKDLQQRSSSEEKQLDVGDIRPLMDGMPSQ